MMSLVFGNLAQDFVSFNSAVAEMQTGDPQALRRLPQAAADFRNAARRQVVYLVIIGWHSSGHVSIFN